MDEIVLALRELPFAKPTENVQPEGDVTLVNLPTYFEAQWPTGTLGPGDVSKKVQLLSWAVEFRINPASYNYSFGDGGSWVDLDGVADLQDEPVTTLQVREAKARLR